jgi:hypothetical protein
MNNEDEEAQNYTKVPKETRHSKNSATSSDLRYILANELLIRKPPQEAPQSFWSLWFRDGTGFSGGLCHAQHTHQVTLSPHMMIMVKFGFKELLLGYLAM